MSNPNDFDILPDNEEETIARASRLWLWLLIGAGAFFIFAVGMALATFTNRLGGEEELAAATVTATATMATAVAVAPTTDASATAGQSAPTAQQQQPGLATATLPLPTQTIPATAVPTATPLPAVPPTATAGCTRPLVADFANAYQSALGCPTNDAAIIWAAWEWFERGAMFWRSDNDRAYVFFNNDQLEGHSWLPVDEKWEGQELPSRGDPPPGLQVPQRGFGYAWARRDELFQRLGWATDQERGFCALIQSFERGFIFQSSTVESCAGDLFNQARAGEWRPLYIVAIEGVGWGNLAGDQPVPPVAATATPVGNPPVDQPTATLAVVESPTSIPPAEVPTATPTPEPTATTAVTERQRPEGNGIFRAGAAVHTLDAGFDDWGDGWIPIAAVAEGAANYAGAEDSSGEFQLSWSLEGLYLAVRVRDDRYRPGPNGSEMWQGDTLELHFDRNLSADFDQNFTNEDDYQLGLSWGEGRNEVRLYRWLPLAKEGMFPISGVVTADGEGYRAEVLIPWTLLDVTGDQLQADSRFGFNLSISDNDADAPAQETILSASPSRTTYNNPVEWGTLILQ